MAGSVIQYFRNHNSSDNTYVLQGSAALQSPESLGFSAPEGKIFDSWNTSRDGSGTTFYPGGWAEVPSLYAIWVVDTVDSDVAITYNGSVIAGLSVTGSKTLNTAGKYCSGSIVVSYTKPALQSKTVTPTTSVQNVTPDLSIYGLSQVTVNAIPSAYIIPSGTITISSSGTFDVASYASADVTVTGGPSGLYVEYDGSYVKTIAINSATSIPQHVAYSHTLSDPFSITGFSTVTSIASSAFAFLNGGTNVDPIDIDCPVLSYMGTSAFYGCTWVKTFSASQLSSANAGTFSGCTNLYSASFPALSSYPAYFFGNTAFTEVVLSMSTIAAGSIFVSCSKLLSVSLANCTSIASGVFANCTSLASVYVPNLVTIQGTVFASCLSLSTIDLPSVTALGTSAANTAGNGAQFSSCTKLKEISAPLLKSVLGPGAFNHCESLVSVYFPELTTLSGTAAFNGCSRLENVNLPKLSSITGSAIFAYCSNLQSISFPLISTTSSVYASYWFSNCYNLSLVSFKNIKGLLGIGAFSRCYNLVSLFMMGSSLTALGNTIASMFSSTPVSTYSTSAGRWASIFVPSSLLASYKAATNWTTVSSKIFAYEDYFDAEGNPK